MDTEKIDVESELAKIERYTNSCELRKNLKVGDKFITSRSEIVYWNQYDKVYYVATVTRVTKTQVTTDDDRRFKKDNGHIIGTRFDSVYTIPYTKENLRLVAQQQKEFKERKEDRKIKRELEGYNWRYLDLSNPEVKGLLN